MIVDVQAIETSGHPIPGGASAIYDVRAVVDGDAQTFRAAVYERAGVQWADFIDDRYKHVFDMHRNLLPRLCRLVFDIHNRKGVKFPAYLDDDRT